MSDAPLYCQQCGAKDRDCGHNPENKDGTFCETCGACVDGAPCRERACESTRRRMAANKRTLAGERDAAMEAFFGHLEAYVAARIDGYHAAWKQMNPDNERKAQGRAEYALAIMKQNLRSLLP